MSALCSAIGPTLTLAALSPFIAEVLFGATPASNMAAIVPVGLVYSGAALLIRELSLAWTRKPAPDRWLRIALLGAAHALVEEGLTLRSVFDPDLFNASIIGGRALDLNWLWTQWTLGYHIVWSACIPIGLAEMLHPRHARERWISNLGLLLPLLMYIAGNFAIGWATRTILRPLFELSWLQLGGAMIVITLLVALAAVLPSPFVELRDLKPASDVHVHDPSPLKLGACSTFVGFCWFAQLNLPHAIRPFPLVLLPMIVDAGLVAALIRVLAGAASKREGGLGNAQRLGIIIGCLLPSLGFGFWYVTAKVPLDNAVQGSLSALTLLVLVVSAVRASRNSASRPDKSL